MKNHVNEFIRNVWRQVPMKCVSATVVMVMVCLNCSAQESQTIQLQGKDSSWKLVGSVEPMTGFQIGAKGMVDFGGLGEDDSANAGVTGNSFVKWWRDNWPNIEDVIGWLEQVGVAVEAFGLDSAGSPSVTHWNWIDYINANGNKINYDEGAFFVVLTTNDNPPSKGDASNQIANPALYYWYNKIYNAGGNIAYDKKVWVWAKVHDGGRDPYSTSSFGDNHGSYTIWIDLDNQITADELKTSSAPISLKKNVTNAALTSAADLVAKGKAHHVATILKRKKPNVQAQ